ncbi:MULTISPECIES: hypothetical protein [unclassified Sphingomonas]|uniref:hypothetical protein n=1 Tax=unclassified Sphingomonas TaxID=196159 RepID=UPI001F568013|nr:MULTISPECIES: hypothetical protein [unclassified Sphingomonas]
MSRGPDATMLLQRQLERHADRCGIALTWHALHVRRWASATFVGAQHRLALSISGAGTAAWAAALDEVDLPLRGHLVADLVVTTITQADDSADLGIEVLTVET